LIDFEFSAGFVSFSVSAPDVDRDGIELRLDMCRVILFDHLDTGAVVFRDLVDVGPFHQAQTDVCMPQAVGGSRPAFAVDLRFSSSRIVLKSSRCHFGKMKSVGCGRRHSSDPFLMVFGPFPSVRASARVV
jgi:hypothetical protein